MSLAENGFLFKNTELNELFPVSGTGTVMRNLGIHVYEKMILDIKARRSSNLQFILSGKVR
jgi:hypothetical protein